MNILRIKENSRLWLKLCVQETIKLVLLQVVKILMKMAHNATFPQGLHSLLR